MTERTHVLAYVFFLYVLTKTGVNDKIFINYFIIIIIIIDARSAGRRHLLLPDARPRPLVEEAN